DKEPSARLGQKALAEELTGLLHGEAGLKEAKQASEALFSGEVKQLSSQLIDEAFAGALHSDMARSRLQDGIDVVELLVEAGVVKSKREARQFLDSGAMSLNGQRIGAEFRLTSTELLHDKLVLVRRGKKTWHVIRF